MISLAITKLEHRFIWRMRLVVVVSGGYDLVKSRHADARATRHCLLSYPADAIRPVRQGSPHMMQNMLAISCF
jgi:hypothetical protein